MEADDARHYYEPSKGHGLPHDPLKSIIGPRPIGWISTQGRAGHLNLAPFSFFNVFADDPPIIAFSCSGRKDTLRNAEETGEFVWNLTTRELAERMSTSSATLPYHMDEFVHAGLTPVPSRLVAPPRVAESPVHFECRVTDILRLHDHLKRPLRAWVVFGEVVAVHILRILLKDGIFDTFGAGIVLRAGGPTGYAHITPANRFDMTRPP